VKYIGIYEFNEGNNSEIIDVPKSIN